MLITPLRRSGPHVLDQGKEEVQGERTAEVLLDLHPLMHYNIVRYMNPLQSACNMLSAGGNE